MSYFGIINKIKIRAKLMIVPAFMITFLIIIGFYGINLLTDNKNKIKEIDENIIQQAVLVDAFQSATLQSLATLYRLTTTASAETDQEKIIALAKEAESKLSQLEKAKKAIDPALVLAGIPQAEQKALDEALKSYIKAGKDVAEMAADDAATASAWMTKTYRRYQASYAIIDRVSKEIFRYKRENIKRINENIENGRFIFAVSFLLISLLSIAISYFVGNIIAKPMLAMAQAVTRLAHKDYALVVPGLGQQDELGQIAEAVDILKQQSQNADELEHEKQANDDKRRQEMEAFTDALTRLANKDYTADVPGLGQKNALGQMAQAVDVLKHQSMTADRLEQEQRRAQEIRQQEMRKLAQVFETGVKTMIDQLSQKTIEIKETADHLAQNASATVQRSNEVAAATHEMSGNMQAVAAATEELTGSVSEIGRQVNQSTQSTRNAVVQVVNTDKVVHTLSETSAQIGEIVNLIRGIAGQTNLLALNANIESARAGQAGDGFRVVASEVKQLANQTAKATDEIETQITSMKEAAGSSVLSITDIRKTITMIDELFDQIAGAVRAQGEAIGEIASNIHQATQGSTRVSVNISSVNQSVEETGSMAQAVQQAVSEQEAQFIKLRKEVDSFIKTVLSA